jgi:predicted polyphosphate/ATP-dependent NAD kinase
VFDNAEKGHMVFRLLAGLGAAGVERVLMMPAGSGLSESLTRTLHSHRDLDRPRLEILDLRLTHTVEDTVAAVAAMRAEGVAAIAVLGGDGTARVVARECGDVPLCTLSTGTNNAFPAIREATVAGLATGLLATGRVPESAAVRRAKAIRVRMDDRDDVALVDAALTAEPWVGARALLRASDVSDVVLAFAEPSAVGLSAIGGLLEPVGRFDPRGLHLTLSPAERSDRVVTVPLAPGLVVPVGVKAVRALEPGEEVVLEADGGSLALDGEREHELTRCERVSVSVSNDGPYVVDVDAVMAVAAARGLLAEEVTRKV